MQAGRYVSRRAFCFQLRVMTDAFELMMQRGGSALPKPKPIDNDPIVTAVVYRRWLEHVNPSEPLWHVPYFGQSVRVGTPQKVAEARWKQEDYDAKRGGNELGLLAVLDYFGAAAMDSVVLEHRTGPRSVVQAWADRREKELIAEGGGTLRDMEKRLTQTLNISTGGKFGASWATIDALRAKCFNRFKREMEAYVEEFGTSSVPVVYVNPLTGAKLGSMLAHFRRGTMRRGALNQQEIEAWAEALPGWAWNALQTEENRKAAIVRASKIRQNMNQLQWMEAAAKQSAIAKRKQHELLVQLPAEERQTKEKKIAHGVASTALTNADLALLRTLEPNAKRSDLPRARREGLIPTRSKAGRRAKASKTSPLECAA